MGFAERGTGRGRVVRLGGVCGGLWVVCMGGELDLLTMLWHERTSLEGPAGEGGVAETTLISLACGQEVGHAGEKLGCEQI